MADDASWRGRLIDERYRVDDVLGEGGMGVVLRARHQFTGALVALKVLREELAQDPELQRRFLAEARAGNAIGHHGIVQVLDAGRDKTGQLYLAMELLAGESLRAPMSRGSLTAADIVRIGGELADALGAAHAHGFVHRDLKPENVFLVAPSGAVKLLDFGIAKMLASDATFAGRTAAGVVMGTPAYMPPEQLRDARSVDARADLWALGVMLYEMLAGRGPFVGRTFEELFIAITTTEPTPIAAYIPNPPAALVAFFARALARDPVQRFATSAELAAAFAAAVPVGISPAASRSVPALPQSVLASGFASAPGIAATAQSTAPGIAASPAASSPATPHFAPLPPPPPPQLPPQQPLPQPPQQHQPQQPLPPPPPEPSHAGRNALWIGGAVLVAIGTVVIAHFATKPPAQPPPAVAAALPPPPPDAAILVASHDVTIPIDAAAPAPPPIDAAPPPPPPPIDAAVPRPKPDAAAPLPGPPRPPQPPPPQPPPQPAAPTTTQICTAACNAADRCNFGAVGCMQACASFENVRTCLAAANTCNALASCGFLGLCGSVPAGRTTCRDVAVAQGNCSGNLPCACRAAQQLAPQLAAKLAAYDNCAIACNLDQNCMNNHCIPQANACAAAR